MPSTELLPERYRGPERIGRGGMADVYRATDTLLDRTVAIKVLAERYAGRDEIRRRFTREAMAAARLSGQRNTVTIYDVGEWHDRPYIVMEYLGKGSLEAVLRHEGAQRPERALAWLEQAAGALDHAHSRGVVHRDVKPANLLLDESDHVHVADFGIATAAGLESLTETGTVLGTAGYLAPEQAEGRPTTAASDRYALGVVAFELLTGSRPFQSDSTTAEATAHVNTPAPAASERADGVPRQADAVFRQALAKDPAQRFSSCGELVHALRAAYDDAEGATQITAAAPPRRRSRWPLLLALVPGLLAAGVLAAVLTTRGGGKGAATIVRTVTAQGKPITVTEPAPASRPATAPGSAPNESGGELAQTGFSKLQAGDFQGALPLLRLAVQRLAGTNTTTEAYADYNLAYALVRLGSCDGVLGLIDRSQAIQGERKEFPQIRKACGGKHGHGYGYGR